MCSRPAATRLNIARGGIILSLSAGSPASPLRKAGPGRAAPGAGHRKVSRLPASANIDDMKQPPEPVSAGESGLIEIVASAAPRSRLLEDAAPGLKKLLTPSIGADAGAVRMIFLFLQNARGPQYSTGFLFLRPDA
jgi:hypothetical protein